MSILNALLTEKAVLYACVKLVAFQQKYLIIVCRESLWFPRPEPCIYNLSRFEQLPLSPQNEKGRGRGELVMDSETESLNCLLYYTFEGFCFSALHNSVKKDLCKYYIDQL